MEELAEELSEIDLPCKTIEDVVDEFHTEEFVNHRGQDQDDSTTSSSTSQSSTGIISKEADESLENEPFRSFQSIPRINTIIGQHT